MKGTIKPAIWAVMFTLIWAGCRQTETPEVKKIEEERKADIVVSPEEVETAVVRYLDRINQNKQGQGQASVKKQVYAAGLSSLNESGLSGVVVLDLEGEVLNVQIDLRGAEPGQQYIQHVREVIGNKAKPRCPDSGYDSNGDGRVDLAEGISTFGSIRLNMDPFPVADSNGEIRYSRQFTLTDYHWIDLQHMDLTKCNVVLCGMSVGNEFDPMMPSSCGSVFKAR